MAHALVTDSVVVSLTNALFKTDVFKITVTHDQIPEDSPLQLNTKSLGTYIRELRTQFPNRNLRLKIELTQYPVFKTNTDGAHVDIVGTVLFLVEPEEKGNEPIKAFLANLKVVGSAKLTALNVGSGRKFKIFGKIENVKIDFKLKESYMGDVSLDVMERFLNIIVGGFLFLNY